MGKRKRERDREHSINISRKETTVSQKYIYTSNAVALTNILMFLPCPFVCTFVHNSRS